MVDNHYPNDIKNYGQNTGKELQISLICLTALDELEAVSPDSILVQNAKKLTIECLLQLRLRCTEVQETYGSFAMK